MCNNFYTNYKYYLWGSIRNDNINLRRDWNNTSYHGDQVSN